MSLSKSNRTKSLTSELWNFFTPDSTSTFATCNMCKQKFSYRTTTTNLRRHMKSRHPTVSLSAMEKPRPSTSFDRCATNSDYSAAGPSMPNVSAPSGSMQQGTLSFAPKRMAASSGKKITEKLMLLFTHDLQPFSVVDDKGFREFVAALNPAYQIPSRHSISKAMIPAIYEECLAECKAAIDKARKVCLTTDCWTSVNTESFMAVTAHFIDHEFKLRSLLLQCCDISGQHTSENLAAALSLVASEWNIQNKIILTVSDNAANIKCAINQILKWKHFACFAHSINLIVKRGLEIHTIQNLLERIRTIVSHFKRSTSANEKFSNYQKNNTGRPPLKLLHDVSTRWNSTHCMIQRFVDLEESVKATIALLDKRLPILSSEEWRMARELVQVLKPFESVTKAVSGDKYATASLVIPLALGLNKVCATLLSKNFSDPIKLAINSMKHAISERFGNIENSSTLLICTFIDPRFKTLAFSNELVSENAKKKVIDLVAQHLTKAKDTTHSLLHSEPPVSMEYDELSVWSSFDKSLACNLPTKGTSTSRAIIEVNRYLEDDILPRHENSLVWWKDHQYNYPCLSTVVQEQYCALGSSVPCEQVFSKAGLLLSERRNRLTSNKAKMLIFLNSNS